MVTYDRNAFKFASLGRTVIQTGICNHYVAMLSAWYPWWPPWQRLLRAENSDFCTPTWYKWKKGLPTEGDLQYQMHVIQHFLIGRSEASALCKPDWGLCMWVWMFSLYLRGFASSAQVSSQTKICMFRTADSLLADLCVNAPSLFFKSAEIQNHSKGF